MFSHFVLVWSRLDADLLVALLVSWCHAETARKKEGRNKPREIVKDLLRGLCGSGCDRTQEEEEFMLLAS